MYDDLAKRLRYCSEEHSGCGTCELSDTCVLRTGLLLQAADAIEELSLTAESYKRSMEAWADEAANAQPRWIPVTERLPEVRQEVLVYLWGGRTPYIAWIEPDGVWETNDFYIDIEDAPKAWMPLPKPPKEDA